MAFKIKIKFSYKLQHPDLQICVFPLLLKNVLILKNILTRILTSLVNQGTSLEQILTLLYRRVFEYYFLPGKMKSIFFLKSPLKITKGKINRLSGRNLNLTTGSTKAYNACKWIIPF